MASATARVLALSELLERILFYCEPQTLEQAEAVSRFFETQIASSLRILQKFFYAPYTKVFACPLNDGKALVPQVIINPFLLDLSDAEVINPVPPEDMGVGSLVEFTIHPRFWSKSIAESAACRHMHILSPPLTKIEFLISHHESPTSGRAPKLLPYSVPLGEGRYNLFGWIEDPEGVTIGDVLHVLEECGVAGDLSMFSAGMRVELDEARREEISYEGKHYMSNELVEVKVDDERLMSMRLDFTVQQSDGEN